MDRIRQLLVAAALVVGLSLAGAVPDTLLPALRTQAREVEGQDNGLTKWEYCALSKAVYAGPPRAGVYWISYLHETGVQVVEAQASATDGGGAAFAKAINKLGSEGWEMVAPGPLEVSQGQVSALYFKRPKQSSR